MSGVGQSTRLLLLEKQLDDEMKAEREHSLDLHVKSNHHQNGKEQQWEIMVTHHSIFRGNISIMTTKENRNP